MTVSAASSSHLDSGDGIVDHDEGLRLGRWVLSAAIVVAAYAGLVAAYMMMKPKAEIAGASSPPVLIDLAPEALAPETENNLAPGEESVQSQETPVPEVKQAVVEEPILDVPPTETPDPEIVIPLKREEVVEKTKVPTPKPPVPVKEMPVEIKKNSVQQQRSAPKTPKRARSAVAPNPGSVGSTNAVLSYRSMLSAHINRFKRPAGGRGTAVVSFVVDRSGRVVSRSLARSSGNSAVDAEAMATIARAAPMPAFPAAVTQSRLTFAQAIHFN